MSKGLILTVLALWIFWTVLSLFVGFEIERSNRKRRRGVPEARPCKARVIQLGGKGRKDKQKSKFQGIIDFPCGIRVLTDAEKNPTAARNRIEQFCARYGLRPEWEGSL